MKNKIRILAVIIIIIGIILIAVKGLVFDLNYAENRQIQITIDSEFELKDIEQMTKEVFNNQDFKLNIVGEDEDTISIKIRDYTDEQLLQLNDKINDKYGLSNNVEDIERYYNTNVRGRDIVKHFVVAMVISTVLVAIYSMIKYRKLKPYKVFIELVLKLFLSQMLLISIYSITRLPISRVTMSISIVLYLIVLTVFTAEKEKQINKPSEE